jgi:hypothetical protein
VRFNTVTCGRPCVEPAHAIALSWDSVSVLRVRLPCADARQLLMTVHDTPGVHAR